MCIHTTTICCLVVLSFEPYENHIKVVFCFSSIIVLIRFVSVVLGKFYLTIFISVLTYGMTLCKYMPFFYSLIDDHFPPNFLFNQKRRKTC